MSFFSSLLQLSQRKNSHLGQKCLLKIWFRDPISGRLSIFHIKQPKLTRVIYILQSIPLEKRPLQEHLPPDEVRLGSCPGLAEGPAGFAGNSTLTHQVTNSRRGKSPTDPLMFYSFQEGCLLPLICSSSPNLLPL